MVLTNWVHHRDRCVAPSVELDHTLRKGGPLQVVFRQRYLFLIALLIMLSNVVNTNGEFILGKCVIEHAQNAAARSLDHSMTEEEYIGKFYADFYFWVNLVGLTLQMFAVSRIMKSIGIGAALLFLPVIALGGYTMLAFAPMLTIIRATKIAENGADYSIHNTARHALFLRTDREAKYKGITAIDSFFWRAGDAISAGIVFVGTSFTLDVRSYATANATLTVVWLCIAAAIVWLRVSEWTPDHERPHFRAQ